MLHERDQLLGQVELAPSIQICSSTHILSTLDSWCWVPGTASWITKSASVTPSSPARRIGLQKISRTSIGLTISIALRIRGQSTNSLVISTQTVFIPTSSCHNLLSSLLMHPRSILWIISYTIYLQAASQSLYLDHPASMSKWRILAT